MNFYIAILILKIKENTFLHIMLYYFKKGKHAIGIPKKDKKFVQCIDKGL